MAHRAVKCALNLIVRAFEPARIGVDVLDLTDARDDMLPVGSDDGLVFDADVLGKAAVDLGAIRDQQRISRHHWPQKQLDDAAFEIGQHGVRRRPMAVAYD